MKLFGLTGNMGCGKSTVAALLAEYPGVLVLDCDRIAKEIISNPAYRRDMEVILGTDVYVGGVVSTKQVAGIIFAQPAKKRALETCVHPLVWESIAREIEHASEAELVVVESAILYEVGDAGKCDGVIVATCGAEEQLRRLRDIRRMTSSEIESRLAWQLSAQEKEKRADFLIDTECSKQQLSDRIYRLYQSITKQT